MADRYYIGARYVPAVYEGPDGSNTWVPGVAYDGLVIVTYGNYSYMSKKPVPAGMYPPDVNAEYWIRAAVYNADVNNVVEQLANKADKDGVYRDLFAGNLISDIMQTDNAPYLERETGGGLSSFAPLCYPVLVGASVEENQLLTNLSSRSRTLGITITANNDGSITITGTATANNNLWFKQNVPFMANRVYLLKGSLGNGYLGVSGSYSGRDTGEGCLYKFSSNNSLQIVYGFSANVTYNETLFPEIIDLTQKLGSTIADYAYTLEQATAGSGIAWLRSYGFLGGYVPYNTGTIESVEATAKVVRDENGVNAITYPLGNDVLNGIFKLDASNRLYAYGDRKTSDGVIARNMKLVDLGTLNWFYSATQNFFSATLSDAKLSTKNIIVQANVMKADSTGWANMVNGEFGFVNDSLRIHNDNYPTTADFVSNYANGKKCVYELATPTTEQSTPFTSPQIVYPDGTEEFITENNVPVGHETRYQYDLKGILEQIAEVPAANGTYTLKATRSGANITYTWDQEV